ncbi:MAG: hypothetical protein K0R39_3489 [Symbiobacteriaceae bacterium]|jgi:hypothetical protein|nr:hypothetical protein [Symbiobacteriaceae bacterium]
MDQHQEALLTMFLEYADICNRFDDMETACRYFTADGWIEAEGTRSQGAAAVKAVHDCDAGCRALVFFEDVRWDGETMVCNFIYETELDRALGIPGLGRISRITFRDGLIDTWLVEKADPADLEARRPIVGPVFAWAKEHRPDLMERARGPISYDTGYALVEIAEAWRSR